MIKLFLFLLVMGVALSGYSQSLVLIFNGIEHADGDTLTLDSVDPNLGLMKAVIGIKNKGESSADVKVKKTSISLLSGSQNLFCWGTYCYSGNTNESQYAVTIPAKTTNLSFYAEYAPAMANVGKTVIEYKFYDVINAGNSAKVIVRYIEGKTEVIDLQDIDYFTIFTDNAGMVRISTHMQAKSKIVIQNQTGQILGEFQLTKGTSSIILPIPTGKGIYVGTVIRSNKIIQSKKFLVF
jgi:hypothetical protein